MSNKVIYREPLGFRVGRFLKSKGFYLANSLGNFTDSAGRDSLGILYVDPKRKPTKYLFGFITKKPRRDFLGIIYFNNGVRGATNKKWYFEVCGRKNIGLAKRLSNELAKEFKGIKITIDLACECQHLEDFGEYWG